MCGPMSGHLSALTKTLTTNITRVRFFSRMVPHVCFQMTAGAKKFTTQAALIRFLPRMTSFMNCEVLALTERFPTNVTVIRFLPGMGPHVHDEMLSSVKSLVAFLANKLFFACVYSFMDPETTDVGESLGTNVTEISCVVTIFHVSRQLVRRQARHPTHGAIHVVFMCFYVLHQRADVLESLATKMAKTATLFTISGTFIAG